MSCNRPSRAAAEIQNLCSCRQSIDKEVMPHFIVPGAVLTVAVPRRGVSLVVLYDAACEVRHAADMGARHGRSRRALRVRYCPMTQCVLKGCGSRARERAAMCPSPSPPPLLPHWQFSGRQNPGGPIERTSELFSCDPRNTAGFFVVVGVYCSMPLRSRSTMRKIIAR